MIHMQPTHKLSIATWNVRGLYHQIEEAKRICQGKDIVCLGETWIRPGENTCTDWLSEHKEAPISTQGSA